MTLAVTSRYSISLHGFRGTGKSTIVAIDKVDVFALLDAKYQAGH